MKSFFIYSLYKKHKKYHYTQEIIFHQQQQQQNYKKFSLIYLSVKLIAIIYKGQQSVGKSITYFSVKTLCEVKRIAAQLLRMGMRKRKARKSTNYGCYIRDVPDLDYNFLFELIELSDVN